MAHTLHDCALSFHPDRPGKNTLHAACVVLSCEERYFTAHMLSELVAPLRLAHGIGVKVQMQGPAAVAQLHCDWSGGTWAVPLQKLAAVLRQPTALVRCGLSLVLDEQSTPALQAGKHSSQAPSLQPPGRA